MSNDGLIIDNITFGYNQKDEPLIKDFSLSVEKGSFTTLLGESGSGKTTILRLISGFLHPQKGSIIIDGENMTEVEPDRRKIGLVFQDYALFPHMTVKNNILYGLKLQKKYNKDENEQKIEQTIKLLSLDGLEKRYPHELSGGQQQRVALARAIVLNPQLLLMDEPLSSLDAKLRERVRQELKDIQQELGITTVYVTHDQDEALSLSDSIAVIKEGKLLQYDSPQALYFKSADKYTADFIGRTNFITIASEEYMVRPEWLEICPCDNDKNTGDINGIVVSSSFLGDLTRFSVKTQEDKIIIADLPTLRTLSFTKGRPISLNIIHKWKI